MLWLLFKILPILYTAADGGNEADGDSTNTSRSGSPLLVPPQQSTESQVSDQISYKWQ